MKRILFGATFLLAGYGLFAQESDLQQIERTLNYYLQGGTNNDFATLEKAFHPTASMRYITDAYQDVNAVEFFRKGMKAGPRQNRLTRITSIDVDGHAAQARLEIEYETFMFIDYMSLLKIEGEWKIVSKIFYRKIKAEK
ncbi:MAG: nuclear transport factor 2 family protein [Bacteroidota bacterium]